MEEALSKHLDSVCRRMGGFLRGFDDPAVYLSPASAFIVEFRKLMSLPVLHQPGEKQLISYAAAVASYRVSRVEPADGRSNPVSTMLDGLAEPSLLCPDLRRRLPLEMLGEDLIALLRKPALHIHITVSNRAAFSDCVDEIARADGFPVVQQQAPGQNAKQPCPFCQSPVSAVPTAQILKCESCLQPLESVRWLPMVPAVAASVSFELLRRLLALPVVESYQQEGKIVPLETGSGTT